MAIVPPMTANEVIAGFRKLLPGEQAAVVGEILSEADDEAVLSTFDRFPRSSGLDEGQILMLPRSADPAR
ncbi:MAG: hypothetical protein J0L84_15715 [Verrucomicrobia bacterium]|nr:hypothetical protein [Verrucomicrobiota bacterium]